MIRVLAWPDYALEDTNSRFAQLSGIKVVSELFNQNEDAFHRVRASPTRYDVVFADGHWPERYLQEELTQPLRPDDFRSWKGVMPRFKEKCLSIWPAGRHESAAYPGNWGLRGLIWDPSFVSGIDSWNDLWRLASGHIWINSQGSEFIAETGLSLGIPAEHIYDLSDPELANVANKFMELAPRIGGIWTGYDEIARAFERSEAHIAEVDSTAIVSNLEATCGKGLKSCVPKEGTIGWIDGAMISSGSKVPEEAIAFIDFLFSPEGTALQWAHSEGYPSANGEALDMLLADSRYSSKVTRLLSDTDLVLRSTLYQAPRRIVAYQATWRTFVASVGSRTSRQVRKTLGL
jgi:spermidine/putrescine-binding protein